MDKVQVILGYLRKYHFWLLCLVAMIASLVGWSMARSTLSTEYQTRKGEINGKFSALQSIAEPLPNGEWKDGISKITDEQRDIVGSAWEHMYEEQKKVLKWPDVLGEKFLKWIDENPTAEIPQEWRGNYQNYAGNAEFSRLLEIVDAAPPEVTAAAASAPLVKSGKAPEAPTRQYKVVWDTSSQSDVKKSLDMPEVPSSQKVRLTQEDLWVYQALLRIIRATNEGEQWRSRVRRIEKLLIGKDAGSEFEEGMKGGHIQSAVPEGPSEVGNPPPEPTGEEAAQPLDAGRYVDAEGKRIQGEANQTPQFKRMPIYLRLEMDQREIARLLTECANSPLPVEVRQLRINPDNKSNTTAKAPPSGPKDLFVQVDPYEVKVTIHGIIYIYNPPDPEKLGVKADAGGEGGAKQARQRWRNRRKGGGKAETPAAEPAAPAAAEPAAAAQ